VTEQRPGLTTAVIKLELTDGQIASGVMKQQTGESAKQDIHSGNKGISLMTSRKILFESKGYLHSR
jgi:hypothetical protein